MKLELTNPNYCATIVKVKETRPLEKCDNLVGVDIFGYNVITSKGFDTDALHVLFTTETQLSDAFLKRNNLYSSELLNANPKVKGYIGANGRVRAIKLRGHPSNAMLMPISSLPVNPALLKEGDKFNSIDGRVVCSKYEAKKPAENLGKNKTRGAEKKYERVDGRGFPQHFDTEQYLRNEFKYAESDKLIITQKLHGTSVRFGNVVTRIKPTLLDKILRRQRTEYDVLAGSRRVVKDLKSEKEFNHYYATAEGSKDVFNSALDTIKDKIPKDVMLYAEIVGYNWESEIQKGYTYGYKENQFGVYVYRITSMKSGGFSVDWGWETIKAWCKENGVLYVPELEVIDKADLDISFYTDKNLYSIATEPAWNVFNEMPIEVGEGKVDEWICIRREGFPTPYVTKYKSPAFYEYETKMLDDGVEISS